MIDSPLLRFPNAGPEKTTAADKACVVEWLEPFAAPSRCGCQRRPWVVVRREGRLEMRLASDDLRYDSYASYREGFVCAGAAIENLSIALYHAGYGGAVELLPDRGDPSLLCVVRPDNRIKPSEEDEALFAVLSRPLVPNPSGRRRGTIAPALLALLRHAARQHRAWLDVVADSDRRRRLEAILRAAQRATMSGPGMQAGQSQLPPALTTRSDAASFTDIIGALGSTVRGSRCAEPDAPESAHGARLTEGPILLVLGTYGDRPLDWLCAGQALQHVLLHASSHELSTTFLNEPLRHAALRDGVRAIAGRGEPQVIARLDFGAASGYHLAPALFPAH